MHVAYLDPVCIQSCPSVALCVHPSMQGKMSHVQMQIQQDWQNREFIEVIAESIRKITEFLNSFDLSARSRLSQLNEKLTALERQVDYIEARMGKL